MKRLGEARVLDLKNEVEDNRAEPKFGPAEGLVPGKARKFKSIV